MELPVGLARGFKNAVKDPVEDIRNGSGPIDPAGLVEAALLVLVTGLTQEDHADGIRPTLAGNGVTLPNRGVHHDAKGGVLPRTGIDPLITNRVGGEVFQGEKRIKVLQGDPRECGCHLTSGDQVLIHFSQDHSETGTGTTANFFRLGFRGAGFGDWGTLMTSPPRKHGPPGDAGCCRNL